MSELLEAEVKRRVALCLKDAGQEIDELREKLMATDFRAAVAEWAVAGVMALNVSFRLAPEDLGDHERLHELSRMFAKQAAAMLLERAELHFRQHGELWTLKASLSPSQVRYRDPMSTTPPPKASWPRPFAKAKT